MYPCSSLAGHFSSSFRPDGSFHLLDCPLQSLSVGQLSLETTQGKKKTRGSLERVAVDPTPVPFTSHLSPSPDQSAAAFSFWGPWAACRSLEFGLVSK